MANPPETPAAEGPEPSAPPTPAATNAPSDAPSDALTAAPADDLDPSVARRRLAAALTRGPSGGTVLAAVLLCALGFGVSTQLRTSREASLESLSQPDLVALLDSVNQESTRLDAQIARLERTRNQLSGNGSDAAAEAAAQQQLTDAQLLSGTVPASGPGAVITLRGSTDAVPASIVLDAVQELRDAGAEAIDLNGVRVVASTSFVDRSGGLTVSGQQVAPPYVMTAIGESATLTSAMQIPGGIAETVRGAGGTVDLKAQSSVRILSVHTPAPMRHASPAASATPGSSPVSTPSGSSTG